MQRSGKELRPTAPLHNATTAEATRALLRHRAEVTRTESHGVMALHLAATRDGQALQLLLEAKAPLAAKDLNQQTALHFAARAGHSETLALLVSRWLADEAITAQGRKRRLWSFNR